MKITTKCENCGETFSPRTTRGRFCSDKCRVYYWREQKRKNSLLAAMRRTTNRLSRLYDDFNDEELRAVIPQHRLDDIEDAIDTAERELAVIQKEAYKQAKSTNVLVSEPFAEEWEGRLKLYLRRGRWIIEYGQMGLTLRDAERLREELRKIIDRAYEIQDREGKVKPRIIEPEAPQDNLIADMP